MTHWMLARLEWRSLPRVASATFTIVVSRIDMTAPSIATPEMIQTGRGMWSEAAAGRGAVVDGITVWYQMIRYPSITLAGGGLQDFPYARVAADPARRCGVDLQRPALARSRQRS